jgi:hypothetical protein
VEELALDVDTEFTLRKRRVTRAEEGNAGVYLGVDVLYTAD